MKKRLTALAAIVMSLWLSVVTIVKPTEVKAAFKSEVNVHCDTIYMMDMETGTCVYEKNPEKKKLPASLTKMMTCIIAYERADSLDEMVVIDSRAVRFVNYNKEGVTGMWTNLKTNERFTLRDLLYEALVASENCAAEAIGYYISKQYYGSDTNEEFISFMNDRAEEIGCTNTHFKCASGLTADYKNHYSTAHDMAIIANHLMKIPELAEIAYTPHSYGIAPTNLHDNIQWVITTNQLIREGSHSKDGTEYFYQYCEGVKTGYLDASGHCFAAYAKKNGRQYICVLMDDGVHSSTDTNMAFVDAKKLFEWAFNNLTLVNIYKTSEPIAEIPLNLAWNKDSLVLVPQDDFSTILPSGVTSSSVIKNLSLNESVDAPVRKGDVLGTAELSYDGEVIGTINLVASESVKRSNLLYVLSLINKLFSSTVFRIILVAAILGGAGYILYSYNQKQKMSSLKRSVKRRTGARGRYH